MNLGFLGSTGFRDISSFLTARLMVSLKKSPCQAGRRVMKVSPYDKTGVCYASLEDVPEKAGTRSRQQTSIPIPMFTKADVVVVCGVVVCVSRWRLSTSLFRPRLVQMC